jgi:hypothetical protein
MRGNNKQKNRDWADITFAIFIAILGLAFITGVAKAAGPVVLAEGARFLNVAQAAGTTQQARQPRLPEEDRVAAGQGNTVKGTVATPTCVPECESVTSQDGTSYGAHQEPVNGIKEMWIKDDPQLCMPASSRR